MGHQPLTPQGGSSHGDHSIGKVVARILQVALGENFGEMVFGTAATFARVFSECAADVLVQHTADQCLIRNSFLQGARPQGLKVGTG